MRSRRTLLFTMSGVAEGRPSRSEGWAKAAPHHVSGGRRPHFTLWGAAEGRPSSPCEARPNAAPQDRQIGPASYQNVKLDVPDPFPDSRTCQHQFVGWKHRIVCFSFLFFSVFLFPFSGITPARPQLGEVFLCLIFAWLGLA